MRLFLCLIALVAPLILSGCVIIPISLPSSPSLQEVTYQRGSGWRPRKIAIIDVSGVLTSGGQRETWFGSDSSVVDLTKKLALAEGDSSIRAIILRVDTPGGGVTASDLMYRELKEFREETGIPIYVSMQSLATSGGYYISMAADKVYASPTTITGSIGVIAAFPEIRGLMDKVGVEMNAIKSGDNKDAGAFYKSMTDEEREIYQGLVEDLFGRFVEIVAANRTQLNNDDITMLADGRLYTAQQALDFGLIDGVAYLDDLIDIVAEEQDLRNPRVVLLTRSTTSRADSPYVQRRSAEPPATSEGTQVNLLNVNVRELIQVTPEAFNYLWVP